MPMSKKHFQAIAKILDQVREDYTESDGEMDLDRSNGAVSDLAFSLCGYFAGEAPAFDRARFLAACGIEGDR